jgi:hypothetical protein
VFENLELRNIFVPQKGEIRRAGEGRTKSRVMISTAHQNNDEMGGACGTCGGEGRCIMGFGMGTWAKEVSWKTKAFMVG